MPSAWLSYVPQYVARDLLRYAETELIGREQRLDVVALFADVSGFTAMSEALGRSGNAGTEELTDVLNGYFTPMIALVQSYGGIVGKFGGDAMTVLFPYSRRGPAGAARRAIQCALDMQSRMGDYAAIPTSAGRFSLTMKAGLALGPVLCTIVGDPEIRLEYIIAGEVLDYSADAEHHATSGEVIVHNELLPYTPAAVVVDRRGDFSRIGRMQPRARRLPPRRLPEVAGDGDTAAFAAFLHPTVARRVATGQSGFINEHRMVTVLFARFVLAAEPGVTYTAGLQKYLSAVIEIVQRYDGYLNKVDMGDKGSKYIVLFGAPVLHENDEERALRCAFELVKLPGGSVAIGVNTGFAFCGQVGSPERQEYTVMGDTVNLSARLMQAAAPGQVLLSEATQREVVDIFAWEQLAPITVKGKRDPITIFGLQGLQEQSRMRLREPRSGLPFVGRASELALAGRIIARVAQNRGQILGVTADAGLGKSRLTAEIVGLATTWGLLGYAGACLSHGTHSSYLVWQPIWSDFFGLDPALSAADRLARLRAQVIRIDPGLEQRIPLLSVVLGIPIPETPLTSSLDAQTRAELLRAMLLRCLRARARSRPLLLVLEDCHWIDPLSQDLLEYLGRNLQDLPVLLVVVYRPATGDVFRPDRVMRLNHATEIRLLEFTPDEARQLIDLKLQQHFGVDGAAAGEIVERITTTAQGNPFYIEELINFMHDRGIRLSDPAALASLTLPDSLHSLILSRIDQLGEEEKITLKVASVIGRVFKARWIWGSYSQAGEPDAVKGHLQTLSTLDLTPLDRPEPELEYIFKHITTQEVAYESLAFAMRATLHERVGVFVEDDQVANLPQFVDVLAYHYGRSRNVDKQRVYFRQAGDAAKASYANQAAIDYYQRLLPLLVPAEQSPVMRELGEVWQLTGKWSEAETIYRHALALATEEQDRLGMAWCQRVLGHLQISTKSYADALPWLQEAKAGFEQCGDDLGLSRTLEHMTFIYTQLGDYEQAQSSATAHMRLAEAGGDQVGESMAAYQLGGVYSSQGELDLALEQYRRAWDVAEAIGYRRGIVHAAADMAEVLYRQDNFPGALQTLLNALNIALEIGYQQVAGYMIGNAGLIYLSRGDYDRALQCSMQGLRIATELGDRRGSLVFIGNVAIAFKVLGRFAEAEPLFQRAGELGRSLNSRYLLCEYLYHYAELLAEEGRNIDAVPLNEEAMAVADAVQFQEIYVRAQILAIRLATAQGQIMPSPAVERLRGLLDTWTDDRERAAAYDEIWRIDSGEEEARQKAATLYRELYTSTYNVEYGQRYTALTGAMLPAPEPLPPLPERVLSTQVDLDALLERVLLEPV